LVEIKTGESQRKYKMNRPSFDEYFGYLVQVIRLRSDDEETQIGCIIADNKNRIISAGYNGTPRGTDFPKTRPEKYPYMVHAEQNAIITACRDLSGDKIYVLSMLPCAECARLICQTGIKEVIVVNEIERIAGKDWDFTATLKMFEQCKIMVRKINTPVFTSTNRPHSETR
jgi:dCMP deaminase